MERVHRTGADRAARAGRTGRFRRRSGRHAGCDAGARPRARDRAVLGNGGRRRGIAHRRLRRGRRCRAAGGGCAGAEAAGGRVPRTACALRPVRARHACTRAGRHLPADRHQIGRSARCTGARVDRACARRRWSHRPLCRRTRCGEREGDRLQDDRRPACGDDRVQRNAGPTADGRRARRGGARADCRLRNVPAVRGSGRRARRTEPRDGRIHEDARTVRRADCAFPGAAAPDGRHA